MFCCFSSRCTFFISFHVSHFVTYPCLLSQVHLLAALLCDYLPHPNVFHLCLIVSPVYLNCVLPRFCATSITVTVAQHSSCDSLCVFLTQFSPLVFALPAPLFVLHARLDWLLLCRSTVKTLNFYLPLTLWSSSLNTWRFLFCRCHWILCPAHSCVKVRGSVFHSLFFFSIRVRVQKTFNLNNPKIYFLYVNVITNEDNMVIVILVPHI